MMNRASTLFRELKRRKVIGTCIFYVLICWGVLQVGDIVAPALGLDADNASRIFLYCSIAGFPLVLFASWFFQITPKGIARTEPFVDRRVLNNIPSINNKRQEKLLGNLNKQNPEQEYDWILSAENGPLAGLSFGITRPLVLGRSLDCEITVISPHISRRHARLDPGDGQLVVEDLGSANGTLVNGQRIEERQPLHHDDQLAFQDIVFRVTESYSRRRSEREFMNQTTYIQAGDIEAPPDGN